MSIQWVKCSRIVFGGRFWFYCEGDEDQLTNKDRWPCISDLAMAVDMIIAGTNNTL